MNLTHDQEDGPITVIVTRTAKKGKIKEFEDWMDGIVHESFWFTPSSAHQTQHEVNDKEARGQPVNLPPRYKMAIVTTGIVFVLLNTLIPQIEELTVPLPLVFSSLLGVIIMVFLMTYLIMPSVTRLLKPWLYKSKLV